MNRQTLQTSGFAALCAAMAFSGIARAGIVIGARRSEDMPRLVLNVNGPAGTIRALGFSADSRRLYAGGMDKAVHAWELLDGDPKAGPRATPVKTLRWEIARGLRGAIYTMAVSPSDNRLAIAGYSTRLAGEVVIYDAARGEVETALRDHQQPVVSLAFAPDGKRLATCSRDGEVRVYTVGTWTSIQVRQPTIEGLFPRPIVFAGPTTVVTTGALQAEQNRLTVFELQGEQPSARGLSFADPLPIRVLAADQAGKVLATCDKGGNLYRWEIAGDTEPKLLRAGLPSNGLTIGDDLLLVATAMRAPNQPGGMLEAYRLSTGELLDKIETSGSVENLAVTISPDNRFAACSGATRLDVQLLPLKGADGKALDKPLTGGKTTALANRGRVPVKVAFAADGSYRIGYSALMSRPDRFNDTADVAQIFDFKNFEWKPQAEGVAWQSPDVQGWQVQREEGGGKLRIVANGQDAGTITLNPANGERVFSYCWLTDDKKQPYALAIGTDVQHGVYIYGVAAGGEWPLLRYYRDHSEWVTSLSVSADGKYLASASADLTIKIWNLEGLRTGGAEQRAIIRQGRGFTKQVAWGANFEIRNDAVVITSMSQAGIANQRGLRVGDVIVEAKFAQSAVKAMNREGLTLDTKQAAEILAGLEATPINEQVLLTVKRLGRPLPQQFLIVPAWEPLATLFADDRGEWACWTPQGYYTASVHGDELFGWQINRGMTSKPDFFRADQFRGDLEKPDAMKLLFAKGSTSAALQAANQSIPEALDAVITNAADGVALVTIMDPPDGKSVGDQGVRVVAKISYRDGRPLGDTGAKAYINGVPISSKKVTQEGDTATVEWNVTPPDPFSRVRVVASKQDQNNNGNFAFADVHVRSIDIKRKPRLHAVALAVGDYPEKNLKLEFPVADAESVIEKLWQGKQGIYEPGIVKKLYNKEVSRASIAKLIEQAKSELGDAPSGDLLVIFIAGHGIAFGNEYYFIPPDARLKDLTPEKAEGIIKDVGISWTQLRQLSNLPCRKVFFLDTCFAGNTLLADGGPSRHMKSAIRPLSRDEVLVLAATAENQSALESSSLGHGVFTKCLLDGLNGGAAKPGTPEVDLGGVSNYLETAVPKMTGQRQTPRSSPTELLELIFIPLVKGANAGQPESFKLR